MLLLGFRAWAGTSRRATPPGPAAAPQSAAFSSCTVPECRANGSRRMHDFAAGIDKFDLRECLFQRNGLYAGAAQAHHAAEFAARDQIRRVHTQPCGQNPVERSGRTAALDVAKHRYPDFLVQHLAQSERKVFATLPGAVAGIAL